MRKRAKFGPSRPEYYVILYLVTVAFSASEKEERKTLFSCAERAFAASPEKVGFSSISPGRAGFSLLLTSLVRKFNP
jgi:hypothetical protein